MDTTTTTTTTTQQQQRPAPYNGERAGELIYDERAAAWIYPASYDDVTLARRRAAGLADGWRLPFAVALFGIGGEPWDVADNPSIAIAIPGYYAFTTHDPRPHVIPLDGEDGDRFWQSEHRVKPIARSNQNSGSGEKGVSDGDDR